MHASRVLDSAIQAPSQFQVPDSMFSLSGIEILEKVTGKIDSPQFFWIPARNPYNLTEDAWKFTFAQNSLLLSRLSDAIHQKICLSWNLILHFSRQVATKQHQITILAVYYFMTAERSSLRNFIQLSLCIKTNDSSTTAEQQLTKL